MRKYLALQIYLFMNIWAWWNCLVYCFKRVKYQYRLILLKSWQTWKLLENEKHILNNRWKSKQKFHNIDGFYSTEITILFAKIYQNHPLTRSFIKIKYQYINRNFHLIRRYLTQIQQHEVCFLFVIFFLEKTKRHFAWWVAMKISKPWKFKMSLLSSIGCGHKSNQTAVIHPNTKLSLSSPQEALYTGNSLLKRVHQLVNWTCICSEKQTRR